MEFDLKKHLIEIKELTESAVITTNKCNIEELQNILKKRKSLIDEISRNEYSKKELQIIYNELKIHEYEEKLVDAINEQKQKLTENIKSVNSSRKASSKYLNIYEKKSVIFNKEV